ncbi:hypothetical protein IG631_23966 [Alternaria alternata]|nr:hypothetical protein IG631_23966 [Alternaria alternata]
MQYWREASSCDYPAMSLPTRFAVRSRNAMILAPCLLATASSTTACGCGECAMGPCSHDTPPLLAVLRRT